MVSLCPGLIFKDVGLRRPAPPGVEAAAAESASPAAASRDAADDEDDRYPDSPVAGIYDAGNTDTKLLQVNDKARPKSGSKLRGEADLSGRCSKPNPKRHSAEKCPRKNPAWHTSCLDSSSPRFEPRPKTADMWTNSKQRPARKPGDDSYVNQERHQSCLISSNPHWFSLEYSRPRRHLVTKHPPRSMSENYYLVHPDLSPGNAVYLWSIARTYDVTNMKQLKQQQYLELLRRQIYLGTHSRQEYQRYRDYISSPRTRPYGLDGGAQQKETQRPKSRAKSAKTQRSEERSGASRPASVAETEKEHTEKEHSKRKSSMDSKQEKEKMEKEPGRERTLKHKKKSQGSVHEETEDTKTKRETKKKHTKPKHKDGDDRECKAKGQKSRDSKDKPKESKAETGSKKQSRTNPTPKKTTRGKSNPRSNSVDGRPKPRAAFLEVVANGEDAEKKKHKSDADSEPEPERSRYAQKQKSDYHDDSTLVDIENEDEPFSSNSDHSESWDKDPDGLKHSKEGGLRPKSRLGNRQQKPSEETTKSGQKDGGQENSATFLTEVTHKTGDEQEKNNSRDQKDVDMDRVNANVGQTSENKNDTDNHVRSGSPNKSKGDEVVDERSSDDDKDDDTDDEEEEDESDEAETTEEPRKEPITASASATEATEDALTQARDDADARHADEVEAADRHENHVQLQRQTETLTHDTDEGQRKKVTEAMFTFLANEGAVVKNWKFILVNLGLPIGVITSIEADNFSEGLKQTTLKGFQKWKEVSGDSATLDKLYNALKTEKLNYTAETLMDTFADDPL